MADANAIVEQAVQAYKANNKAAARDLLLKAVDLDERNEQAWMWMSAVVESQEEQQICLENVLSINPNNDRAQKGLAILKQKLANKGAAPAAPPPAPASGNPFGSADFDSNPFAVTGFDSNPFAAPAAGSGTGDPSGGWDQPAFDPMAAPTSVDWGNKPSETAAYGSGKAVDLPSSQEYDSWISNLGIGDSSASSSPAASPSVSPFTMDPNDPWASLGTSEAASPASPPPSSASPFEAEDPWASVGRGTTNLFDTSAMGMGDPWGSAASAPSSPTPTNPFEAAPDVEEEDPWGSGKLAGSAEPSTSSAFGGSSVGFDEAEDTFEAAPASKGFSFDFDDDDGGSTFSTESGSSGFAFDEDEFDESDPFGDVSEFTFDDSDDVFGESAPQGKRAPAASKYLRYVPEELRPSKAPSSVGAMVGMVLLLVLNAAAVVGILMA